MWHSRDREGMETLQTSSSYVHHHQLIRVYFSYRYSRAVLCEVLSSSVDVIIQGILSLLKLQVFKEILVYALMHYKLEFLLFFIDQKIGYLLLESRAMWSWAICKRGRWF